MSQPELFDVVELLVNLPDRNLQAGAQGTIVECHTDEDFEIEFITSPEEEICLHTLSRQQFVVVWKSATQQWLTVNEN